MKPYTKILQMIMKARAVILTVLMAPALASAVTFSYTVPNPSPTSSYGEFINFCTVDMYNTTAPLSNCWYYLVNPAFNTPLDSPFYAILNPVATPAPSPTPNPAIPPVIYAAFSDGTVGVQYSQVINVILESPTSSATILFTGLPSGLSFNGVDTVSGVPSVPGTYNVTIDAIDNTNSTVTEVIVPLNIVDVPVPQDILCSSQSGGLHEVISTISPQGGWLSTLTGPLLVKYPSQANTVLEPGMVTFSVGDSVTYNGIVDQSGVFCVASSMNVYAAPVPSPSPTPVPSPSPTPVPSPSPTPVPSPSPTPVPVASPTPTPVVACPTTGAKVDAKSKVASFTDTSFSTISGKIVNFLPCTKFSWSGVKAFKVGDSVEWKAFMVNGTMIATKVTVN